MVDNAAELQAHMPTINPNHHRQRHLNDTAAITM
jgi:hypothetical protein